METSYKKIKNKKFFKKENWEIAIGLNKVDNLYPSNYLKELIEDSISGKKTYIEIENCLNKYYQNKNLTLKEKNEKECDIVSTRIANFLENNSFTFSPVYLKAIHKYLFDGVFPEGKEKYVGEFRDYNISKAEDILNGKSVIYGDSIMLMDLLKYDFDEEKNNSYENLTPQEQIERLSKFTSSIWQVHPFIEGNTRTTALFIEKYLRTIGYNINNDLFKENVTYFRNSLVLSNYSDLNLRINSNFKYLNAFFSKLILNKDLKLPIIHNINKKNKT